MTCPSDPRPSVPTREQIGRWVRAAIAATPVYDLHTHLYPPAFGELMLWGVDHLLTYHYLAAETIRATGIAPNDYFGQPLSAQADLVWQSLFVERAPLSEACRGVLTVLQRLGLGCRETDLARYRAFFAAQTPAQFVERALTAANVSKVVMTNDPFDAGERAIWLRGVDRDPRFQAVLRVDPLLLGWPNVSQALSEMGYAASPDLGSRSLAEIRRFLGEWISRMKALYVAVSLPPTWNYPDDSPTTRVIDEAILPVAAEHNIPFALMIGVRRQVNPRLRMAGDMLAKSDIGSLLRLCERGVRNKFLVTMLARENQHELSVAARKFPNLMIFGCWWFLNNPSLIEEITRMRVELLGESFIPQHSDCRVLDQLIYKWDHSREVIGRVLSDKFSDLAAAGAPVDEQVIARTARRFFSENFERFLAMTPR